MIGEGDLSAYFLHLRHGKYMGEVTAFFSFFFTKVISLIVTWESQSNASNVMPFLPYLKY